MSLRTRLDALVVAVGADIKSINAKIPKNGAMLPTIGGFARPPGMLSAGEGAMNSGRQTFHPITVGPIAWTTDAFRIRVTRSGAGGSYSTIAVLYGDDGTGFPNTATVLAQAPVPTSSDSPSGIFVPFSGSAVVLNPGMYWLSLFYYEVSSPSQMPLFLCITNQVAYSIPSLSDSSLDVNPKGYRVFNRTAIATSAISRATMELDTSNDLPLMGLRRSA